MSGDPLRAALVECLGHMFGRNMSDLELWREHELGNGVAIVLLRARAALDPKGKAAELISPLLDQNPMPRPPLSLNDETEAHLRAELRSGGYSPTDWLQIPIVSDHESRNR